MQGMAFLGANLHFSYGDMIAMELKEFLAFVDIAVEMLKRQAKS